MCTFLAVFLFGLFVAATLVQIAFWQLVFARCSLGIERSKMSDGKCSSGEPVSVLLCVRNEADNLRRNLPVILEQQYPAFEVLVIDDDSTDGTAAALRQFQKTYAHLRVLHAGPKTRPGKKAALEQGIRAARFEWLAFTDADCRPAGSHWLRQLSAGFGTPPAAVEIVLGYGPYRQAPGALNRWIRFETVQTAMQYFSFARIGLPYMGVGRNLAWRRQVFERVGGFDAHASLASGDDDLLVNAAARRHNTAVCLDPAAFVYSEGEPGWRQWWRQKQRHLQAGRQYRPEHQALLGLLALTQVLHYFLLIPLASSDFGIISVVLYAIRMASAFPIYWKVLRQFRDEQLLIWFPLLDALLAFYYAVFVPLVLIRSNYLISWK